jgi:hypothetical protein
MQLMLNSVGDIANQLLAKNISINFVKQKVFIDNPSLTFGELTGELTFNNITSRLLFYKHDTENN